MATDKEPWPKGPLNQKKIIKAKNRAAASGARKSIRDSKRLWLNVTPSERSGATTAWVFRKQINGHTRDHGLGSWPETSIEKARELAIDAERRIRDTGVSPIDVRKRERLSATVAKTTQLTFGETATQFLAHKAPGWRSPKSTVEFRSTILGTRSDGTPSKADWCRRLRPVLLTDITTPLVVSALEQKWGAISGPRIAQAISSVFQWALARQLRQPPNPADWEVLSKALASPTKAKRVTPHHAAMDYKELPAFFAELQQRPEIAAKALQFLILTAARTGEIRGARHDEFFDLDGTAPLWMVPSERMKGHKEHRIPLSQPAVSLLKTIPREPDNPLVFVSTKPGKPINHDAMLRVLSEMGRGDITCHGFRSSFSDYCHECTATDPLVIEHSLAHRAGDKTTLSYRRGDLTQRRRALMELWAQYLVGELTATNVTPLHGGAAR
jgi:integrase